MVNVSISSASQACVRAVTAVLLCASLSLTGCVAASETGEDDLGDGGSTSTKRDAGSTSRPSSRTDRDGSVRADARADETDEGATTGDDDEGSGSPGASSGEDGDVWEGDAGLGADPSGASRGASDAGGTPGTGSGRPRFPGRDGGGVGGFTRDAGGGFPVPGTTTRDAGGTTPTPPPAGGGGGTTPTPPPASGGGGTTLAGVSEAELETLRQLCVDEINRYRATLGLAPLARAADREDCSDNGAQLDGSTGRAHGSARAAGASGTCPVHAQNTCPGWGVGPRTGYATLGDSLKGCLKMMWAEGAPPSSPCTGACYQAHGHYLNMSARATKRVACGFYAMGNGKYWMNQNFW